MQLVDDLEAVAIVVGRLPPRAEFLHRCVELEEVVVGQAEALENLWRAGFREGGVVALATLTGEHPAGSSTGRAFDDEVLRGQRLQLLLDLVGGRAERHSQLGCGGAAFEAKGLQNRTHDAPVLPRCSASMDESCGRAGLIGGLG